MIEIVAGILGLALLAAIAALCRVAVVAMKSRVENERRSEDFAWDLAQNAVNTYREGYNAAAVVNAQRDVPAGSGLARRPSIAPPPEFTEDPRPHADEVAVGQIGQR